TKDTMAVYKRFPGILPGGVLLLAVPIRRFRYGAYRMGKAFFPFVKQKVCALSPGRLIAIELRSRAMIRPCIYWTRPLVNSLLPIVGTMEMYIVLPGRLMANCLPLLAATRRFRFGMLALVNMFSPITVMLKMRMAMSIVLPGRPMDSASL